MSGARRRGMAERTKALASHAEGREFDSPWGHFCVLLGGLARGRRVCGGCFFCHDAMTVAKNPSGSLASPVTSADGGKVNKRGGVEW